MCDIIIHVHVGVCSGGNEVCVIDVLDINLWWRESMEGMCDRHRIIGRYNYIVVKGRSIDLYRKL